MIYLCCSRLPDAFSVEDSACSLKSRLSGIENAEYINKIASRAPSAAAEGLYAVYLLLKLIDRYFPNTANEVITFSRSTNGKPYFDDSPLKFSISHSGGIVACAVSDCGEVGVDVETANISQKKALKLADRFFTDDEIREVKRDPQTFTRIWTRKEAASKFFGENLADFIKKTPPSDLDAKIYFHSFTYCQYPVTLCTARNFDKIILLDDSIK